MKRIITAILLLFAIWANAQQQVDSLRVKQSLRIKDARITNVTTDTSLSTNDLTIIAPAATIKQYFQNNIKSVSGSGQNMANTNLVLTANRKHYLNGRSFTFFNSLPTGASTTSFDSTGITLRNVTDTTNGAYNFETKINSSGIRTSELVGNSLVLTNAYFNQGTLTIASYLSSLGYTVNPATSGITRINKDSATLLNNVTGKRTLLQGDSILTPNIRLTYALADNSADSIAAFKNGLFVKIARSNIGGLDTTVGDGRYTRLQRFLDSIAVVKSLANSKLTQTDADNRYARVNFNNTFAATNIFLDSVLLKNNTNNLIAAYKSTFGSGIGTGIIRAYNEVNSNYIGFSGEGNFQSFRNGVLTTLLVADTSLPTTNTMPTNVNGKFASSTGRIELGVNDVVGLNNSLNNKADKATTITVGSGTSAQDLSVNRSFLTNVPNVDATQRSNHTGTQLASTISDFTNAARSSISVLTPLTFSNGIIRIDTNAYVGKNRNNDTIFGDKVNMGVVSIFNQTPTLRLVNSQDSSFAYFERSINDNSLTLYNSALQLSGSGNSIQLNTNSGGTAPYTEQDNWSVSGWVYGGYTGFDLIFAIGDRNGNWFSLNRYDSDRFIWFSNVNQGIGFNIIQNNFSRSNWVHFAVTFDGFTTKIYINKLLVAALWISSIPNPSSGFIYLGNALNKSFADMSTCELDQILVYNRVLTQNGVSGDIDLIYNGGIGNAVIPINGLIRRWEWENNFGTGTAIETSGISGGPYNFTLNNVIWATTGIVPVQGNTVNSIGLRFRNAVGSGEKMESILGDPLGRATLNGRSISFLFGIDKTTLFASARGIIINPNGLPVQPDFKNTLNVIGSTCIGLNDIEAPTNGLIVSGNSIFSNITTKFTTTIAAQINLGASTESANTGQIFFPDGVNQTTVQNGLLNRVGGSLIWNVNGIAHLTPRALRTTATLDFPSIAAGATATLTVTLINAVEADIADVSIPIVSQSVGLIWGKPRVTATNTIALDVFNPTASAIDPPSGDFVFIVNKFL